MTSRLDEPADVYIGARWQVSVMATRQLLRLERAYRADATRPNRTLGRTAQATWAAARDELRQRGRPLPPTERRPLPWRR
jgi:hypothetical protein